MNVRKSEIVRVIKFIIGGIAICFSGYRFLNVSNSSPFFVTYPGIAVLIIGIVNILKGILNKSDSKMTRTIEVGIGIIAITVGLFVRAYVVDTSSRMTMFIFIFLIIQGIGFIATGITQRGKITAIRISKIVIGPSIIAILTGLSLTNHDIPIVVLSILLSINLFVTGIEIIIADLLKEKVQKQNRSDK